MVAAAGESSGLAPRVALACLGASLAGLLLVVLLADRLSLTGRVPLDESAETLAVRADEIAARAGYAARPFDRASGLSREHRVLRLHREERPIESTMEQHGGRPAPRNRVLVSHEPARARTGQCVWDFYLGQDDPPRDVSGMVLVVLDTKGRLLEFEAVPPQTDPKGPAEPPDWGPLIAATGLETAALNPAEPEWVPEDFADTRAAWTGAFPELPKIPIRVEAAAFRGKPIAFRIVWPWTTPTRQEETEETQAQQVGNMIFLGVSVTVLVGSVLVARRNVRLNRGDRRGAFRLAMFVFTAMLASWASAARTSQVPRSSDFSWSRPVFRSSPPGSSESSISRSNPSFAAAGRTPSSHGRGPCRSNFGTRSSAEMS